MNEVDMMTSAVALQQSRLYEQLSLSTIKMQADAQQKIAQMLLENTQAMAARSEQARSRGGIDIYA